jgi:hypothetical protein
VEARENPSGLAAPILGPHQEAGYTSAVVTVAPDHVRVLQSGGVHIRPHMTLIPSVSSAPLRRRSVASEKMRAEYQPQAGKGHWLDVRGCFQQLADEVID